MGKAIGSAARESAAFPCTFGNSRKEQVFVAPRFVSKSLSLLPPRVAFEGVVESEGREVESEEEGEKTSRVVAGI